jgi:N-formylglutamate amidohydrolase
LVDAPAQPSFDFLGAPIPASPVVLSVPHAGRDYPRELFDLLRVPAAALLALEDRHVDAIAHAARRDETMLVARRPRAWIDLNRSESERDPRVDAGTSPAMTPFQSPRVKNGLGLVPRRAGGADDLWQRRLSGEEVAARIAADHRPYHAALADTLEAARQRFGVAVLLDIHSMPTLNGNAPARIVLGDRFGRSACGALVECAIAVVAASGLGHALNTPYAGGYILDRHGRPDRNVHAIQIEFDRALYLDMVTQHPHDGVACLARLLRALIDALANRLLAQPQAAE